jgi:hypothetical protein
MKDMTFPLQCLEATELFRVGQVQQSPLSRQQRESVVSFISRHRRWWRLVKELDKQAKHLQSRLKAWRRDAYFTPLCSCHDEQMGELNRMAQASDVR